MSTTRRRFPFALLLAMATMITMAFVAPAAQGVTLGLDFTGGNEATVFGGRPRTNGYAFEITEKKLVTALGFWDEDADGLGNVHDVTLWTEDGTQLATVVVDTNSPLVASTETGGDWRFEDLLSPVVLMPGSYVIGGGLPDGIHDTVRTNIATLTITTAPFLTLPTNMPPTDLNPGRNGPGGEGTNVFPTTGNSNIVLGPNLLFADAINVPEPASIAMLALGSLSLTIRRRAKPLAA